MAISKVRRWWAVGALALSALVVGVDVTILNVALPTLAAELGATTGELQWFANAFNLVFAALLLPAGLTGDRFGRKKLLIVAFVLFGAASVGCAYSGDATMLIIWRCVLGLGAAFIFPLSLSVLPVLFPPAERPKAIAVVVTGSAAGVPLGPIVGGWLLTHFWWGSVFLINVPLILVTLLIVTLALPDSRSPQPPSFDPLGIVTATLGLTGITYGAIRAGEDGWGDPAAAGLMASGALMIGVFVAWQRWLDRRGRQSLVDLSLFRSASFTWGVTLATVVSFALFGLLFAAPQYFQAVLGTDALGTGIRLLPFIGGMLIGAPVAERIAQRVNGKAAVTIGFVLAGAGLLAGAQTDLDSGYGYAAAWITVVGMGMGFALPQAVNAAVGSLSVDRTGVGTALVQTVRQVGGTIGVAFLGTILSSAYHNNLDLSGLPPQAAEHVRDSVAGGVGVARQLGSDALLTSVQSAFIEGMARVCLVSAGIALVGVVLTLVFLPRNPDNLGDEVAVDDAVVSQPTGI